MWSRASRGQCLKTSKNQQWLNHLWKEDALKPRNRIKESQWKLEKWNPLWIRISLCEIMPNPSKLKLGSWDTQLINVEWDWNLKNSLKIILPMIAGCPPSRSKNHWKRGQLLFSHPNYHIWEMSYNVQLTAIIENRIFSKTG